MTLLNSETRITAIMIKLQFLHENRTTLTKAFWVLNRQNRVSQSTVPTNKSFKVFGVPSVAAIHFS